MELVIPIIAGIIKTIITSIPYGIKISKSKFDKKYFSISKKVFMFIVFDSFLYKKFWIIPSLKIEKSRIIMQGMRPRASVFVKVCLFFILSNKRNQMNETYKIKNFQDSFNKILKVIYSYIWFDK